MRMIRATNRGGFLRDRRANVAIITAVAFPLILGFVGLASEAALWMLQRRVMQGVADAAAYSGAVAIANGNTTGYQTEAKGVAEANGYTTGVTVNSPPSVGNYTAAQYGANGYEPVVEVIISTQPPTLISAFFGATGITIAARATAAVNAVSHQPQTTDCVLALDPTAAGAVTVSGSGAALSLNRCGLAVDSNATPPQGDAITNGSGASIMVDNASITLAGTTNANITVTNGILSEHQKPVPDPYAYLTAPTAGSCPASSCTSDPTPGNETGSNASTCNFSKNQSQILSPGTYCNNDWEMDSSSNTEIATLLQGTYILNAIKIKVTNGVLQDCSAFASISASGCGVGLGVNDRAACQACKAAGDSGGVTIIQESDTDSQPVDIEGSGNIQISAPTTGTYAGIAFWTTSETGTLKLSGNAGSLITGAVYTPKAALIYHGGTSATASGCVQVVADTITITGGATYDGLGCQAGNGTVSTGGKVFGLPGLVE